MARRPSQVVKIPVRKTTATNPSMMVSLPSLSNPVPADDAEFLRQPPLCRLPVRCAAGNISRDRGAPSSGVAFSTKRELLEQEVTLLVKQKEVHDAEVRVERESETPFDSASGVIVLVDHVDEHVLAGDHSALRQCDELCRAPGSYKLRSSCLDVGWTIP